MTLSVQLGLRLGAGPNRLAALQPELGYHFPHVLVKNAADHARVKHDQQTLRPAVVETLAPLYANPNHPPAHRNRYPLLAFNRAGHPQP